MKTETKEHEINHVSETAERVEPTAAEIQARHDRSKSLCLISENPEDDADIDISELNAWIKAFNVQRRDRGILLKRLTAAEELNDDQAHRLGKAEATIKAIQALEHISIVKVRALQDLNPELAKSQWVLYSSESTCKYPTIEALLNRSKDQDNDNE